MIGLSSIQIEQLQSAIKSWSLVNEPEIRKDKAMFVIRQQQVIATLENHQYIKKILPMKLQTRETYDEAIRLVYASFADSDAQSQYSVISNGGKFIHSIKLGELDGFRNPGEIRG